MCNILLKKWIRSKWGWFSNSDVAEMQSSELVTLKYIVSLSFSLGWSNIVAIVIWHCVYKEKGVGWKISHPTQGRVKSFETCQGWEVRIGDLQPKYGNNTPSLVWSESFKFIFIHNKHDTHFSMEKIKERILCCTHILGGNVLLSLKINILNFHLRYKTEHRFCGKYFFI